MANISSMIVDIQATGFQETKTNADVGMKQPPSLRVVMPIAVENQTVNVGARIGPAPGITHWP
jgi:hypothetical protein